MLSSDFHEHFDDALALAINREAWRVLKPGGRYVIKTPNLRYLKTSLAFKRLRGRDCAAPTRARSSSRTRRGRTTRSTSACGRAGT